MDAYFDHQIVEQLHASARSLVVRARSTVDQAA